MIHSGNFSMAEKHVMDYWSRRWGIGRRELQDAILQTGSLNPVLLRKYLRKTRRGVSYQSLVTYLKLTF